MSDDFLQICHERGFFHQCTDENALKELLSDKNPVTAYIGFDCTAPSLHVGGLLQIMMLRWFQKCGHKPIVLMGGGTTKVGDPTGKDQSRQILTNEQILENMNGIKKVFSKRTLPNGDNVGFLDFEGDGEILDIELTTEPVKTEVSLDNKAIMYNNDLWLSKKGYIEILSEIGRYISVNEMLARDSVKQRLEREQHLSFLEFNYMVLQAYDFMMLRQNKNCRLQMGGSDQWGNILAGVDLNHKFLNGLRDEDGQRYIPLENGRRYIIAKEEDYDQIIKDKCRLFGLTSPLITTASGAKMGKTVAGAIWLDADMLSPYDYWQFWRNTEDGDVERFLKLFTELPLSEIAQIVSGNINDAKKRLATEATTLLHGAQAAQEAAETARKIFEEGGIGGAMPECTIDKAELEAGIPAFKLLHLVELVTSGKEGRRAIQSKSARINDTVIEAEDQPITLANLTTDGYIKLSLGKKKHLLVRIA